MRFDFLNFLSKLGGFAPNILEIITSLATTSKQTHYLF